MVGHSVTMSRVLAAISLAAIAASAAAEPEAAAIEGHWKNPSGTAIIAIAPCGNSLCGKVAWASKRGQREASPGAADVVGTTVLTAVRFTRGHWTGKLFIPDDNIHVSARLEPVGSRTLKLTGCAFAGIFCRSQLWSRFDGPLPPAD